MSIPPGWHLAAAQILLYPPTVPAAAAIAYQFVALVREWQWHYTTRMVFICAPAGSRVVATRYRARRRVFAFVVDVGFGQRHGAPTSTVVSVPKESLAE